MKQIKSDIEYINKIGNNINRIKENDVLWGNIYNHTIVLLLSISDLIILKNPIALFGLFSFVVYLFFEIKHMTDDISKQARFFENIRTLTAKEIYEKRDLGNIGYNKSEDSWLYIGIFSSALALFINLF